NIYINSQEIHSLQGKNTPVSDGDEMAVIPAIAGGQVLTPEQVNRYSRHIIMPQVGPVGQRKLMETKVLIVGAGGLGGPAALYLADKVLVDGSILLFDGQATVFKPGHGCYRCLFPAPPPPGLVPNCAEAGVLGALTGVMGSIQAIEVIKQVLEIGDSLVSRLLLFDALAMDFRIV